MGVLDGRGRRGALEGGLGARRQWAALGSGEVDFHRKGTFMGESFPVSGKGSLSRISWAPHARASRIEKIGKHS